MAEVVARQGAALNAPSSRQDVVSELLDDYAYGNPYDPEDMSPKSSLAPAFKELPPPPPRTDSLRDPKAEAFQRMNTKFQLRGDDNNSVSSNGSRSGSLEQTPRTRITSRSLSRSGTPPSLKLFVSNGATAYIPPTPVVYPPVKPLPSSDITASKELPPPPPPERSVKRKELQAATMGHKPSKSELERNDSFHSQDGGRSTETVASKDIAAAPPVKRKAVPGPGVQKFIGLLELNNGPRGGKSITAPTSAPRETGRQQGVASKIPIKKDMPTNSQLPPTPPEEQSVPSLPRKALVSGGLPSNPRTKQPMSPLHARGKSSTGFNILKAQRPAPPVPTMKKEVTTPEMTPSPTLKPEIRMDNEISPMKPLPPPSDTRSPFSFKGPSEQGSPKQITKKDIRIEAKTNQPESLISEAMLPTPASQPSFPLRTTSLDPPEPSPSIRPSTAPAPQSTFTTTHPSLSTSTLPLAPADSSLNPEPTEPPFIPLTKQSIPLPITLIPRITPSQLSCYTQHRTNVWSNNFFQPMGCMVCHSNEKDRKWTCTWCQLRVCRACSEALLRGGRDLRRLLEAREQVEGEEEEGEKEEEEETSGVRVVVEDVDMDQNEEDEEEAEGRGRNMMKGGSRARNQVVTPRE